MKLTYEAGFRISRFKKQLNFLRKALVYAGVIVAVLTSVHQHASLGISILSLFLGWGYVVYIVGTKLSILLGIVFFIIILLFAVTLEFMVQYLFEVEEDYKSIEQAIRLDIEKSFDARAELDQSKFEKPKKIKKVIQ